jgi:hypothetical protein
MRRKPTFTRIIIFIIINTGGMQIVVDLIISWMNRTTGWRTLIASLAVFAPLFAALFAARIAGTART